MHYVLLTVGVGKHAEKLWCAVTCLGKVPLILSHDWFKKHNPDIDWTTGDVKLSHCKRSIRTHIAQSRAYSDKCLDCITYTNTNS